MKRKLFIVIGLVTVTGLSAAAMYARRGVDAPAVVTDVVSRGDIRTVVTANGSIEAVDTVQVGTQVSGTIQSLGADFNSIVKKGQVLARLDPSIIQADIERQRANLLGAEADAERLRVQLNDATTKLGRARELAARQLIAASDLDAADITQRSAEAQVKAAMAQVTQARAALAQADVNLQKTVIKSPIDGIVISRSVELGQTVAASLQAPTLYTIAADLRNMQLKASIDESDLGSINKGQAVTFRVDAYPNETFAGTRPADQAEPGHRVERSHLRGDHLGAERGVEAEAGHDGDAECRNRAEGQRAARAVDSAAVPADTGDAGGARRYGRGLRSVRAPTPSRSRHPGAQRALPPKRQCGFTTATVSARCRSPSASPTRRSQRLSPATFRKARPWQLA